MSWGGREGHMQRMGGRLQWLHTGRDWEDRSFSRRSVFATEDAIVSCVCVCGICGLLLLVVDC